MEGTHNSSQDKSSGRKHLPCNRQRFFKSRRRYFFRRHWQCGNQKSKVGTSAWTVGQVDLLAAEQTEQYTNMMGRWRKHALEAVSDPLRQRTIAVLNQVKMPLTHVSCFLKKVVSEKEMHSKGNTLHQLVCRRSESFLREFDDLLCSSPHFW